MKKVPVYFAAGAALAILCLFGGCSPQERAGVSPLPQNRPARWEYNPLAR